MKSEPGFSLVELLICLLLLSALAVASVSFGHIWQRNHLQVLSSELQAALHYARNSAIMTAHSVLLVPSGKPADWSTGMLLCLDNPAHQCLDEQAVLHQWAWGKTGITVRWQGFSSPDYLVFSPQPAHARASGSFYLISQGVEQRTITLNRIGRIKTENNL